MWKAVYDSWIRPTYVDLHLCIAGGYLESFKYLAERKWSHQQMGEESDEAKEFMRGVIWAFVPFHNYNTDSGNHESRLELFKYLLEHPSVDPLAPLHLAEDISSGLEGFLTFAYSSPSHVRPLRSYSTRSYIQNKVMNVEHSLIRLCHDSLLLAWMESSKCDLKRIVQFFLQEAEVSDF